MAARGSGGVEMDMLAINGREAGSPDGVDIIFETRVKNKVWYVLWFASCDFDFTSVSDVPVLNKSSVVALAGADA